MFERGVSQESIRPDSSSSAETELDRAGGDGRFTRILFTSNYDAVLGMYLTQPTQQIDEQHIARRVLRNIADRLCAEHTSINMDAEVLGGTPHIKGTRLSVGKVLSKLYLHGSIQAVVNIHKPHISEEQVKEAIAYAQDFMEMAGDSHETP
jgi:uncharacterized protein (DUF433 family)